MQKVVVGKRDATAFSAPGDTLAAERWTMTQYALLFGGALLVWTLLFRPAIGIAVMWNVIIPILPALFVLATGIWRNICPMATFSLLPRRFGLSRRRTMPSRTAGLLGLASLAALFLILPLRHVLLNTNGPMTALMLIIASLIAAGMGFVFQWRSGWCTSLCPIHPVEKLYGFSPMHTANNMRCGSCGKCTTPCPDSTRSMTTLNTGPSSLERWVGQVLTGGFVGFIFGWCQLDDLHGSVGAAKIVTCYVWPFGCAAATFAIYAVIRKACRSKQAQITLAGVFAAAAVSTYYWYRLPALAGFGTHPGAGVLYDLTGLLPSWVPAVMQVMTTSFFAWFMVIRRRSNASWMIRPAYDR